MATSRSRPVRLRSAASGVTSLDHRGGWSTCFAVASTDATVEGAGKSGGKVILSAQDTPYGRLAVLEDPWGAAFAVMQVAAG